MKLKQQMRR